MHNELLKKIKALDDLKQEKFKVLCDNAQKLLTQFKFKGLTFEYSGLSLSHLIATMETIKAFPGYVEPWFALDYTYKLGEKDHIILGATENEEMGITSVEEFVDSFRNHIGSLFAWKENTKERLLRATSLEEVESISVEYYG